MTVTNRPEGIDMSQEMTEQEYNQLAARLFADYCMGRRNDYLPTNYTGTEEQAPAPLTEEEAAKAKADAEEFYRQLNAGEEINDPERRVPPTAAEQEAANRWANELFGNN